MVTAHQKLTWVAYTSQESAQLPQPRSAQSTGCFSPAMVPGLECSLLLPHGSLYSGAGVTNKPYTVPCCSILFFCASLRDSSVLTCLGPHSRGELHPGST